MKIARIQVDNFLGAHQIDVRLTTPVTLFAGPNGAAKSSIGEAVRMAITGESVRIKLKKEYAALVTEGATAGGALLTIDDDRTYAFNVPNGKVTADDGLPTGGAVAVALNGQQFSAMTPDERRTFLFVLAGVRAKADDVRTRMLLQHKCEPAKIEATLPLLRTGFPDACEFASKEATKAKGAWRAVTGGVWGINKAEGWAAPDPDPLEGEAPTADQLAALDADIANANQHVGQVAAQVRSRNEAAAKRNALKEKAGRVQRATEALEYARKELADYEPKVVTMRQRADGGRRVGLVHDLAYALYALYDNYGSADEHTNAAQTALQNYEDEHGAINDSQGGDPDSISSLPEYERGLEVMQAAVKNCERDLADVTAAKAQFDALAAPEKEEALPDLEVLQAGLTKLKADRAALQEKINAATGHAAAVEAAKKKTEEAAKHHAEVLAWSAVADALAPDGIPGELLKEALKPVNEGLAEEATVTGWKPVCISPDMEITAAGRQYSLLSESEQWRTDAMIAVTVARLSGLKILMLDRVDVLDLPGRKKLLGWVDALVKSGDIETALLFATLKGLPANLYTSMTAHWVENGEILEMQEAA